MDDLLGYLKKGSKFRIICNQNEEVYEVLRINNNNDNSRINHNEFAYKVCR